MTAEVLCFGNMQCDVLCRVVNAMPPPGETRRIEAIELALGGNGATVAAVLGRLGVPVDLAGYGGADLIGERFRAMLAEAGVGVELYPLHPTAPSGLSVVTVAENGERSIVYVNGANGEMDLDDVPDSWLVGRKVVFVGSLSALPRFSGAAVGRLFARARAHGAMTVLNAGWVQGEQGGLAYLAPALAAADYFVLSVDEGRNLTGHTLPDQMLQAIERETRGAVVLTLGADGCRVRGAGGLVTVPAYPVEALDCTGAGDSFLAGFIAGLVQSWPLVDCARLGCRVASYAVTGPGTHVRVPRLAEINIDRQGIV